MKNKYQRECKGIFIDVYDVLKAFNVVNPAIAHAIKKLLASGQRGYKDTNQDLNEAIASIKRGIELDMSRTTWNKQPRKNRLSKTDLKRYRAWLAWNFQECQDEDCDCLADDSHHVLFGSYKDDTTMINLCRTHHEYAHANKKESIDKYLEIAKNNWVEYGLKN